MRSGRATAAEMSQMSTMMAVDRCTPRMRSVRRGNMIAEKRSQAMAVSVSTEAVRDVTGGQGTPSVGQRNTVSGAGAHRQWGKVRRQWGRGRRQYRGCLYVAVQAEMCKIFQKK